MNIVSYDHINGRGSSLRSSQLMQSSGLHRIFQVMIVGSAALSACKAELRPQLITGNDQRQGQDKEDSNESLTPPVVNFAEAPDELSNDRKLRAKVQTNENLAQYKYKVGPKSNLDCSIADGYTRPANITEPLHKDLSDFPDGPMRLCAIGATSSGQWQDLDSATRIEWHKDTTAPDVELGNIPNSPNNLNVISVTLDAPDDLALVKYTIGKKGETDCGEGGDYSSALSAKDTLEFDIPNIPDGTIRLCVLGGDTAGNWQSPDEATTVSWEKDTIPPAAEITNALSGTTNKTYLDVDISAAAEDTSAYKYKVGLGADCSDSAGYSSKVSVDQSITDTFAELNDGTIRLCVVAGDTAGNWQPYSEATSTSWTKDSSPVVTERYAEAPNWNDYVSPSDNSACDAANDTDCIHGGSRKIAYTGLTSCEDLSLSDNLGVFRWSCTLKGQEAVFYSERKADKGLQDLVNHGSPEGSWKQNFVTLTGGPISPVSSESRRWWDNPVKELPDSSGGLVVIPESDAGTVFTLNSDITTKGYNIDGDKIAFVMMPGTNITSDTTSDNCEWLSGESDSPDSRCIIAVGAQNYVWIEGGSYDGAGATNYSILSVYSNYGKLLRGSHQSSEQGLYYYSSEFADLHDLQFDNMSDGGVTISDSDYADVSKLRVTNLQSGATKPALKFASSDSRFEDLKIANNDGTALEITLGSRNLFYDVKTYNNGNGVYIDSGTRNVFVKLYTANNQYRGVHDDGSKTIFAQVTSTNNGATGVYVSGTANIYGNVIASNNDDQGYELGGGYQVTLSQIVTTNNSQYGIYLWSDESLITGNLLMGDNDSGNCEVPGGVSGNNISSGGSGSDCSPTGDLNVPQTTLSLADSFIGKVTSDDSENDSDSSGTQSYNSTTDWLNFETPARIWGLDGSAFPNSDHRGRCSSGMCRIWDFSLSGSDTALLNKSGDGANDNAGFQAGAACPTEVDGDRTVTAVDGTEFLKNAVELVAGEHASPGNQNGLCESGETCLYSPNFGAYQGHGSLGACDFESAGGLKDIRVYGYSQNGR